jgi:hypothetical protein
MSYPKQGCHIYKDNEVYPMLKHLLDYMSVDPIKSQERMAALERVKKALEHFDSIYDADRNGKPQIDRSSDFRGLPDRHSMTELFRDLDLLFFAFPQTGHSTLYIDFNWFNGKGEGARLVKGFINEYVDHVCKMCVDWSTHQNALELLGTLLHEQLHLYLELIMYQHRRGIAFPDLTDNQFVSLEHHGEAWQMLAKQLEWCASALLGVKLDIGRADAIVFDYETYAHERSDSYLASLFDGPELVRLRERLKSVTETQE